MLSFLKLVQNEYIKIFSKKSTIVVLALVPLISVGLNLISHQFDQERHYPFNSGEYTYDLSQLEEEKPEGYELDVEKLKLLMDKKIAFNDWEQKAYTTLYSHKKTLKYAGDALKENEKSLMQKVMVKLEDALKQKDHKLYTAAMLYYWENTAENPKQAAIHKEKFKYMQEHEVLPSWDDIRYDLVDQIAKNKLARLGMEEGADTKDLDEAIAIREYQRDHNIPTAPMDPTNYQMYPLDNNNESSFLSVMDNGVLIMLALNLIIVLVAGVCVSTEYSKGTVKFLLINPCTRAKILWAKYAMVVSLSAALIAFYFLSNFVVTACFSGFKGMFLPYLTYENGAVQAQSGLLRSFGGYWLAGPQILVAGTIAFALSSLFKSSAVAIGVSLFAVLGSSGAIVMLKEELELDWTRYIVFANTDLKAVIDGTTLFYNHTLTFALAVIAVYMAIFIWIAYDGFVRTDVK